LTTLTYDAASGSWSLYRSDDGKMTDQALGTNA